MNEKERVKFVDDIIHGQFHCLHPADSKDYPGVLVILEGADGAGKTTMAHELIDTFIDSGLPAEYVRTPGGTELGEHLRSILLDASYQINDIAEAYMFQAQLAQCISEVIKPKLEAGKIVVCDRLVLSSLAYQSAGRGQDYDWIYDMQLRSLQGVWPDFGFILFNEPKQSKDDRMEKTSDDFKWRVRTFYKTIAQIPQTKRHLHPIQVDKNPDVTKDMIFDIIMQQHLSTMEPIIKKQREEIEKNEDPTTP